ncbi:hypothetical protein FACS189415_8180 [Bacteroidia bacterium]|nr:hypothetical protein FACS189426_22750 [Bacteroidia bacterium]GHU84828.1 hypothetical protein FACS189415_8180 [Bacteroidia bacterium]
MSNTEWLFSDGYNQTVNEFLEKARIHCENMSVNYWNPQEIAINISEIYIRYSYWNESLEENECNIFLLTADNKSYFTQGELLFKIHNAVEFNLAENLEEHIHFGGLAFCEEEKNNTPVYELVLES